MLRIAVCDDETIMTESNKKIPLSPFTIQRKLNYE